MAEQEEEDSKVNPPPPPPPPFLEVICKSLGKTSRFAAGTKAGFAVSLINRKLDVGAPFVLHIEAVKDGEEPISFGPDAVLVDCGSGWKLQTFTVLDYGGVRQAEHFQQIPKQSSDGSRPAKTATNPGISFLYMAKILVAFVLLFVLGASFTLALENLPRLILLINSFMQILAGILLVMHGVNDAEFVFLSGQFELRPLRVITPEEDDQNLSEDQ